MRNPTLWFALQDAVVAEDKAGVVLYDLQDSCSCNDRDENDESPCECVEAYKALAALVEVTEAAQVAYDAQSARLTKAGTYGVR